MPRPVGLSDATVDALAKQHGRARLIRERRYIHLTVQALEADGQRLVTRELDLVAGPNSVLSVHDGPIEALDLFAEHFHGDTLLGRLDAGSFLAALGDWVATTALDLNRPSATAMPAPLIVQARNFPRIAVRRQPPPSPSPGGPSPSPGSLGGFSLPPSSSLGFSGFGFGQGPTISPPQLRSPKK